MKMKPVQYIGAKRVAFLPEWIPVQISIVDHARVRSYVKFRNQTKTTVHDTGNAASNEDGELRWLAGGRIGGVVGGYQFITGARKVIQTGPLDEESWHAGTPIGNRSFGVELAFGGGADWMTALEINCALHGSLIEMHGMDFDDAAVLHQWWTGKYCSAQILNRGQWPLVRQKIRAYAVASAAARAVADGTQTPVPDVPAPSVYAAPMPVIIDGELWEGRSSGVMNGVEFRADRRTVTVTATPSLNARQYAGTASALTKASVAHGSTVRVLGWTGGELVANEPRWWVGEDYSRYWVGGTAEEPKEWTDHRADEQLQPGVVLVNGRAYYPFQNDQGQTGRRMRVTANANLRRWASTSSAIVGTAAADQEVTVLYWTVGDAVGDERIWYVIDQGEADPLHSGARIWAGLTTDRPK